MKLAIVILNWNGKKLLQKFLPAVVAYADKSDIYVADNASTDDSVAFVKNNFPEVKIIQNKKNYGFALGYNQALKYVEADLYCLLNSDVALTKNWLSPILSQFKTSPKTAIIQPKILDYKNKTKFEYAGAAGGFIDRLGYPYCRGRIFQSIETDQGQYNDVKDIFWATGACMFIKKSVFDQLNGFDADYYAHQEEIDLCWRAHNLGHKVQYVGTSEVYHVGGASMSDMSPQKTFLNFRNSLLNIVKNTPKKHLIILVLTRLFLDSLAGIRFLFRREFYHFTAIIKAHLSFYRLLPKTLKKRENIKKLNDYYSINSLVWNYFIRKKDEFFKL